MYIRLVNSRQTQMLSIVIFFVKGKKKLNMSATQTFSMYACMCTNQSLKTEFIFPSVDQLCVCVRACMAHRDSSFRPQLSVHLFKSQPLFLQNLFFCHISSTWLSSINNFRFTITNNSKMMYIATTFSYCHKKQQVKLK